jgi:hypothetical protein
MNHALTAALPRVYSDLSNNNLSGGIGARALQEMAELERM